MPHTAVMGYGNPLRGDDQIGWLVATRLREKLIDDMSGDVEIISCHQLTPELAEILSRVEHAIFIDACEGPLPGTVSRQMVAAASDHTASFTHNLDPTTLLAMAQALFGHAPQSATILTVTAQSFDYTEELSPPVAAALPLIVEDVLAMLLGRTGLAVTPVS